MYSQTTDEDRVNRYSAEEERGRLLLVTTVDLGDGLTDKIELRAGDCPEVWAPSALLLAPATFVSTSPECTFTHTFIDVQMISIELRPAQAFLQEAAAAFCERNNLPDSVIEPLRLHILENYRRAQQDTRQSAVIVLLLRSQSSVCTVWRQLCIPPQEESYALMTDKPDMCH